MELAVSKIWWGFDRRRPTCGFRASAIIVPRSRRSPIPKPARLSIPSSRDHGVLLRRNDVAVATSLWVSVESVGAHFDRAELGTNDFLRRNTHTPAIGGTDHTSARDPYMLSLELLVERFAMKWRPSWRRRNRGRMPKPGNWTASSLSRGKPEGRTSALWSGSSVQSRRELLGRWPDGAPQRIKTNVPYADPDLKFSSVARGPLRSS